MFNQTVVNISIISQLVIMLFLVLILYLLRNKIFYIYKKLILCYILFYVISLPFNLIFVLNLCKIMPDNRVLSATYTILLMINSTLIGTYIEAVFNINIVLNKPEVNLFKDRYTFVLITFYINLIFLGVLGIFQLIWDDPMLLTSYKNTWSCLK